MLATMLAPNSFVILVSSSHVFIKASGVSIKLVMSLKTIPSIGKSLTVLMYFFKSNLSLIGNYSQLGSRFSMNEAIPSLASSFMIFFAITSEVYLYASDKLNSACL